jgi:pyruvate,water dikinase
MTPKPQAAVLPPVSLAPELGGKAANLHILRENGFPVPRFVTLPVSAFRAFMRTPDPAGATLDETVRSLLAGLDFSQAEAVRTASRTIHALITDRDLPETLLAPYRPDIARFGEAFLAVRSSALGEDGGKDSFAGQMDTFLFVRGEDALLTALKACWASAFSERALSYRHMKGGEVLNIDIAVVIQEMIPADVSGVMFTANPLDGDRDLVVINATYGLGEGIVSGALDTDAFTVRKSTGALDTTLVSKPLMIAFDAERGLGTHETPVPTDLQEAACLTPEQAQELARLGTAVEALYGTPQDIEWALHDGRIHLLQARPITNLKPPRATEGREIIWDNSNITESYSGVTSPLTFSFASHAYNIVYNQVCRALGIPDAVIRQNEQTYRNLLGLVRGRVFYNLGNWYQMTSLLPGFNYNKGFMEQMMGVKEKSSLEASKKDFRELPKLLMVAVRLLDHYRKIDQTVAGFQDNFNRTYTEYKTFDWKAMRPDAIKACYHDLEQRLLWKWQAPIITDIAAMVFYGILSKLCRRWIDDESGSLQNDLLCGEGEIESTEPTKAIMRMALLAKSDPTLAAFLTETPDAAVWDALKADDRFPKMKTKVLDFLDKYGYRCMNELKLEEKNLKEDPSFVFAMVKNYLKLEKLDIAAMEENEHRIRALAERQVRQKLAGKPWQLAIFRWVTFNARRHVKNRENMRFARTKIFGVLRDMFQSIGQTFASWDALDDSQDIFYLNLDEIWGYIQGTATCTDLKGLVALRKTEFARYRQEDVDDRFKTLGTVHHANPFEGDRPTDSDDPNLLKGISCCPGTVKNAVRVIRSPEDDMTLNGQILVAERTDPGWVPLYPAASGLLIERGSILSHSAIVARELGLPTIVGIKNLTKRVKDGQVVEMDARQGIVRLNPEP